MFAGLNFIYKKSVLTGVTVLILLCFDSSFKSTHLSHAHELKKSPEIVFLTWPKYMEPALINEFENTHNVKITERHYESDELRDQMILASGVKGYDVVLASGPSLTVYKKKGWLDAVTERQVPNVKHIDPRYQEAYPAINGYAVPYTWGTVGVAYRKDLVKEPVESWMDLFKPSEELRGRIIMIRDSRDTMALALKALGLSLNSRDPAHYDAAEILLRHQKPYVARYSYVALTEKSALLTGESWMAMVYNGDALALHEKNPNVVYALPREGSALWIDYLVVMKGSQKKDLAYQFINFLNEPKNAARLSAYIMFATPNRAAEKHMAKEHLENRMIYPDSRTLEKCEIQRKAPVNIIKKRNIIFSKLLS